MRGGLKTAPAARTARARRMDLLLETFALRHQLGVFARSHRHFRRLTVCCGCCCDGCGPVEGRTRAGPAGHRRSLVSRKSTSMLAPSREASEKTAHRFRCQDLIRRMAAETCFEGAPLIGRRIGFLNLALSPTSACGFRRCAEWRRRASPRDSGRRRIWCASGRIPHCSSDATCASGFASPTRFRSRNVRGTLAVQKVTLRSSRAHRSEFVRKIV